MGKIVVSEQISLDGVVEDPSGVEGTGRGGWVNEMSQADRARWTEHEFAESVAAEALLLGRRSDAWFAARWRDRAGEWADRLNTMPKYVVSSTLDEPQWGNATVLSGDVVEQVAKLRTETDGDIVVYASALLVRLLLDHDLVDELRLTIHPFVVGAGPSLWGETASRKTFRLTDSRLLGSLPHLTFEVVAA
ncbi:dihydrofolate reductase family protein [Nocardioides bizhenqiangii]|uniref:Dihydrofolate reductase family protein n=1 Tax=Nocardioides bizhenqiangii TaxID=3095076 RepID=A0ABZ0ZLW2_9ACTN|nr:MULTISPECIES: dihydrofolate reductase family protein [unclassified Nocardioides]MDZ5620381.1 dihydrofolate reductase family protein [Nocardioides sp. HM23]WQQ24751.1 dihydrofolate reductase family protein [Nocardioides sp. HM61]